MRKHLLRKMYNKALTTAFYYRYKIKHPELRTILNNKKFENCHAGERCFILGNGPSLKMEDLSLLRDEIVFTVNQATRIPQFRELKSNYHFWADQNFFKIDENKPEDMELLQTMCAVADGNPELECFFPIVQYDFVKKFHLDEKMHVNYFYTGDIMRDDFRGRIDFTKPVFGFGTVVQWCITLAVYMGFSEIYLLGCDNTHIITTIKSVLHRNDDADYAYAVSENEKKRMEKMLAASSLEAYLGSYLRTLQEYRRLYRYCTDKNITLVNCSAETVLDSIPRKRLTDVLLPE
ncbi:MAG: DUF115 domain-containing protein [Clostridia bacterium]|nr:DUF115 domain-containing protein [Clostridia bacterium]